MHTLLSFNHPAARFDAATVGAAGALFVTIFVGSMALGCAFGALSALAFKRLALRDAPSEASLLLEGVMAFAFPWAAFYAAEALRLSGIVTILFCGIFMAQAHATSRLPRAPPAPPVGSPPTSLSPRRSTRGTTSRRRPRR